MHVNVNTSGDLSWNVEDLINNSTFISFRHQELQKLIKFRINPQGPLFIVLSKTKALMNGSIIMEFSKNNLKYEAYRELNTLDILTNTILYEDINEFTLLVKNSDIQFKNLDSSTSASFLGNFTNFIFIGFSSYNPAKWTVQEGEPHL